MALTRNFRETIHARAKRDAAYREAMLTEAIDSLLSGEVEAGKAILRDYINATIGFETLGEKLNKPSKSLHRMLSPAGNPKTNNFFEILSFLQNNEGVDFTVITRHNQETGLHNASS
jgi:DNA-binding phage protein